MSLHSDPITFGDAEMFLIIPSVSQRTAFPHFPQRGQWRSIPYGGNAFVTDAKFDVVNWTSNVQVPADDPSGNYDLLVEKLYTVDTLTLPWGDFKARLASLSLRPTSVGWEGDATWDIIERV